MSYLDTILQRRRRSVETAKTARPMEAIRDAALARTDHRDFSAALKTARTALIAEFKRASPSAGAINAGADAETIAAAYERGGAAALSVLTEPEAFGGSFDDLRAARAATRIPVLCKDFVVDEYQVWEAATHGADALLLIVAALDDASLASLIALCARLQMSALVEAHDAEDVRRALAAGSEIVGVNNRDLHSFTVDLATARRLRALIPATVLMVAESGYRTAEQVAACARDGVDAVLVGEALMRDADPVRAVRALMAIA